MSGRGIFFDKVNFRFPPKQHLSNVSAKLAASRFGGLPAGVQMFSDAHIHYLDFNAVGDLPANGTNWTITDIQGVNSRSLSDDVFPPHVILTNAGADDDSQQLQWTDPGGAGEYVTFLGADNGEQGGRPVYFETMMRLSDANQNASTVEQVDWFVGLAVTDPTLLAGATDFIGFLKLDLTDDATADIDFVCADDGTTLVSGIRQATGWKSNLTASGVSAANTTAGRLARRNAKELGPNDWIKLAFLVVPGSNIESTNDGVAYWFVNDVLGGSVSLAGQVPDTELCISIALRNGVNVAKNLHIKHILVAQSLYDVDGNMI